MESNEQGNVVKLKKANKKDDEPKPRKSDYMVDLASLIDKKKSGLSEGGYVFPNRYKVVRSDTGVSNMLLINDDDVVIYVENELIHRDILQFCLNKLYWHEFYGNFSKVKVLEAAWNWRHLTQEIQEPTPFKFKSDPGLCFHRMPFDPIIDDGTNCPLFAEICSRIKDNADAYRAFIGSIFIPESNNQQYLWLYGQGQNGKGVTIRFLEKCLGKALVSLEPPTQDARFWNSGLLGKRLGVFADINDPEFPTKHKFKMLTGGDPIPMEKKNKDSFTARINCKFLFASNDEPEISGQKSDQRRAIFCDMKAITCEESDGYEDRLWLEAPYIIGWCMETYLENRNKMGMISFAPEILQGLSDEAYSDCAYMFNEYFNVVADGFAASRELSRIFTTRYHSNSPKQLRKFRKWLQFKNIAVPGKNEKDIRGWHGITVKNGRDSDCNN